MAPETKPGADTPGVLIRPPLLYLAGLAAGAALEAVAPLGPGIFAASTPWIAAGAVCAAVALGIFVAAARRFFAAGTNIPTNRPVTALVTSGIYRWSRNPIYVALTLLYIGLALMCGAWWMLVALIVILPTLRYGVIAREEAFLERKFGEPYATYKSQVRRWL